ncbi:hypothetical protein [Flaviflagellibacter deserti]|uniref:Uncharacterized protein n=1 Tax=Flaviflagellibacter deserti TaxID=2267266 RepID=A0ABV9Z447_9HYPH
MIRKISTAFGLAFVIAATAAPGIADASHRQGREGRAAQAIWPSERPYYVNDPSVGCYPKLVTIDGRYGSRRVWVKNIHCLDREPDNLISDVMRNEGLY